MSNQKEFDPRSLTNALLKEHQVFSDNFNRLWVYDERLKYWREDGEKILEKRLRKKHLRQRDLRGYTKRFYVAEILADIKSITFEDGRAEPPHWKYIGFKNGYYDLEKKVFCDYVPEMFFTSKLEINYNTQAKCPTIDRILTEFVPEERVIDLYEIAAYTFLRKYPNHKVIIIYGEGENGKSTYGDIIQRTIGKKNVCSVGMHPLLTNRFMPAELYNRYANISIEVEDKDLTRTEMLKKLTGQDLITAERKHGHPFYFHNHAKLIFMVNVIPQTPDKTHAFFRRIHLLEFPNKFTGKKRDRLLLNKISREEYEGFAFKCLNVLAEMRERDFEFTNESETVEIARSYERLTNPLKTFLNEKCYKQFIGNGIPKDEFRNEFLKWLKENNYQRSWTAKEIGQAMKNEHGIETGSIYFRRDDSKDDKASYGKIRTWAGIQWIQTG